MILAWKALRTAWENFELRKRRSASAGHGVPKRNRTAILLVAQSCSLQESLAVLGAANRWDICWARSGDEAISILKRRPIPLAICDEEAPEGWRNVVERIVFLPQSTCVLLASRFRDDSLRAEATRCFAYDVIAKPFTWEEIANHVEFAWAWYTSGCTPWWSRNADSMLLSRR